MTKYAVILSQNDQFVTTLLVPLIKKGKCTGKGNVIETTKYWIILSQNVNFVTTFPLTRKKVLYPRVQDFFIRSTSKVVTKWTFCDEMTAYLVILIGVPPFLINPCLSTFVYISCLSDPSLIKLNYYKVSLPYVHKLYACYAYMHTLIIRDVLRLYKSPCQILEKIG